MKIAGARSAWRMCVALELDLTIEEFTALLAALHAWRGSVTKNHCLHGLSPYVNLCFARSPVVFLRHRGRWEFYRVEQSGESRGVALIAGYIEQPAVIAALENAARVAWHTSKADPNRIRPTHSRRGLPEDGFVTARFAASDFVTTIFTRSPHEEGAEWGWQTATIGRANDRRAEDAPHSTGARAANILLRQARAYQERRDSAGIGQLRRNHAR